MVASEMHEESQCGIFVPNISVISCIEKDEEVFAKHDSSSGFELSVKVSGKPTVNKM